MLVTLPDAGAKYLTKATKEKETIFSPHSLREWPFHGGEVVLVGS